MATNDCPVCLCHKESLAKYPCGHPICSECYEGTFEVKTNGPKKADFDNVNAYRSAVVEWVFLEEYMPRARHIDLMAKCPMCRQQGEPLDARGCTIGRFLY
jgi:hypothetical protein